MVTCPPPPTPRPRPCRWKHWRMYKCPRYAMPPAGFCGPHQIVNIDYHMRVAGIEPSPFEELGKAIKELQRALWLTPWGKALRWCVKWIETH